jgi:hypothetical protein
VVSRCTILATLLLLTGPAVAQCNFVTDKACYLRRGFNPAANPVYPNYRPPQCDGSVNPASTEGRILQKAFDLSTVKVQRDLCELQNIFVSNFTSYSWGFWENDDQDPRNRSYIGISYAALQATETFDDRENFFLMALINNANHWEHDRPAHRSTFNGSPNSQDVRGLALISLIAHELAHIHWYKHNRKRGFASTQCYRDKFLHVSWKPGTEGMLRRFVRFGDEGAFEHKPGAPTVPHLRDVNSSVDAGNYDTASRQIYETVTQGFATLFGGVSPEEDFVETYRLLAIKNAKVPGSASPLLSSVRLNLPSSSQTVDVLQRLSSDVTLREKADCIGTTEDLIER